MQRKNCSLYGGLETCLVRQQIRIKYYHVNATKAYKSHYCNFCTVFLPPSRKLWLVPGISTSHKQCRLQLGCLYEMRTLETQEAITTPKQNCDVFKYNGSIRYLCLFWSLSWVHDSPPDVLVTSLTHTEQTWNTRVQQLKFQLSNTNVWNPTTAKSSVF